PGHSLRPCGKHFGQLPRCRSSFENPPDWFVVWLSLQRVHERFGHSYAWNAIATANASMPIWSPAAVCPVRELRKRAAELAFQASDIGAVADALEPFEHQRHLLAVLPDLFDWSLRERNRPTQCLRQDLRRFRHRS